MTGPFTSAGARSSSAVKLYMQQNGDGRRAGAIVNDDGSVADATKRLARAARHPGQVPRSPLQQPHRSLPSSRLYYALRTSFTADRSAGRIRWDRPGGAIEAAAPSLGLEASPVNPRPPTRDQARRSCLRTLCERLTHRDCQRPIGVLSRWLPDTNCQDI
jgi:hypothetical protein